MALYLLTAHRHLASLGLSRAIRGYNLSKRPITKDIRANRDLWYLSNINYSYSVWLVEPSHSRIYRKLKLSVLNTGTRPQRKATLYGGYIYAASNHA